MILTKIKRGLGPPEREQQSLIMETQNLLHERSSEIPEGLYIDLMNKLKTDFDQIKNKVTIIVINRSIAKTVLASKKELVEAIIKTSVNWPERENVLININRMSYYQLKEFCISRSTPIMKLNPRWSEQDSIIQKHDLTREMFRGPDASPNVINL